MIELDGADSGGGLVRIALALSALTGAGFRVENVRGDRPTPGLRPQHLAAVRLAAEITDADVSEIAVGADAFSFRPETLRPGTYAADIGTAGSLTLLFDAVLPLVSEIEAGITVVGTGGTDVKWSPSMDYYRLVKLPLLRRFGVHATVDVDRTGFHPAGEGLARLYLAPSDPEAITLPDRGPFRGVWVRSSASMDLADRDVAERQADGAVTALAEADLAVSNRSVTYVETTSTGSVLTLRLDYGDAIAGQNALGERGKPAETVAKEAVHAALASHRSAAAADRYLADQLIPFLALHGGRLSIPEVTDHVQTTLQLVETFGRPVSLEETARGPILTADRRD